MVALIIHLLHPSIKKPTPTLTPSTITKQDRVHVVVLGC